MSEVRLRASDGHLCAAWRAEPAGRPRGAIVVVQEIFGVNTHIRAVTNRWADRGYTAIAPALYDRLKPDVQLGYTEEDVLAGRALRTELGIDLPMLDLDAAIASVRDAGKVGMVGFCWGGLLTFIAAGRLDGLAAAVPYYGAGIVDRAEQGVRCPVMLHFGSRDALIPVERVHALRDARADLDVHIYDADHGFACDARGSFDTQANALAAQRTEAFFARHLG